MVKWQEGDVVGLARDLEKGQILVSVNGSFEAPNVVAFQEAGNFKGEIFAAITGKAGRLRYNLGDTKPFAHAPPAADFEAFCSASGATGVTPTGVPRSSDNAPPQDPTVGRYLGPDRGGGRG